MNSSTKGKKNVGWHPTTALNGLYQLTDSERPTDLHGGPSDSRNDVNGKVDDIQTTTGTDAQRVTIWWGKKNFNIVNWCQPPSDKRVKKDTNTEPRKAWLVVRRLKGNRKTQRTEPIEVRGRPLVSDRKEAEAFTRHYTGCEAVNSQAEVRMIRKYQHKFERRPIAASRIFTVEFSMAELEGALGKAKQSKAAGRDGIAAKMVLNIGPKAKT
ncbi:hypothetical protein EGW08_003993 [Elysia chlorotica]|uniref:Uncharacterized protein n=1 Tax=Elysia chlorotica TaxID=188477 RepID=A0A433U326_ELYCH|nr:hypothetical protein EGW08_003993 [Elysia chlorotica]